MKEIRLTIESCDECPMFDCAYYSYRSECSITGEEIETVWIDKKEIKLPNGTFRQTSGTPTKPIPDSCPLKDTTTPSKYKYENHGDV